ncbi:MAG TPA: hypothetical protein EYP53_01015 [Candidatus Latescibacteria bacterium]|nr:hypothetical protein [Candidatus Latescibacterota bacterium]
MGTLHGIAKFLLMVPLLFFPAGSVFSQDILDYREITVGPEEVTVDNFHGVGVRAMGIGGAYVGVADDFSATYWNPAGLAQIREAWLYGALCHLSRRVNSTFFGESRPGEIGKSRLGSFGVVLPVPTYRGSLVFAIGYNRLKSFDAAHYMNGYIVE